MLSLIKLKPLFGGKITDSQANGINTVVEYWQTLNNNDSRQLAYILATIFWETNKTMQPVGEAYYLKDNAAREAYLKTKPYYPYYGRDLCQTTWKENYQKVKAFSGIDVVKDPALIGQMPLAAKVAVQFMLNGWYTGKKLSDYINGNHQPLWIDTRRVINSLNKANEIAEIAKKFYAAMDDFSKLGL